MLMKIGLQDAMLKRISKIICHVNYFIADHLIFLASNIPLVQFLERVSDVLFWGVET